MIRVLMIALIAGAGAFFIIFQVIKFFFSISNPKSRVSKDRKYGLIKLRELAEGLVPFEIEELRILSIERTASPSRKTFHSEEFGTLSTIYNEPLVAYYYFDYLDERKLLLTETDGTDVELYTEAHQTTVWVNGKIRFVIDSKGQLIDNSNQSILGVLHRDINNQYSTIQINGETRAHLLNNKFVQPSSTRAYPVIEVESKAEALIIYCLSLYQVFEM